MRMAVLGVGTMGKWFSKFAKESDWEVTITDVNEEKKEKVAEELGIETSKDNKSAVKEADIALIAVPIKETSKVIEEVAESMKENSLLIDIASVKETPVKVMNRIDADCELASIHPLFGPGAEELGGKTIVSIPVEVGDRYEEFEDWLVGLGAQVLEMDASEHDRIMSVTQSLTHFTLLTYLSALDSMEDSEKVKEVQTPMFRKLFDLAKAFLCEDPGICGDIQTENRYSNNARGAVLESSRSLNSALKEENTSIVRDVFEKSLEKFDSEEIESAYKRLYENKGGD